MTNIIVAVQFTKSSGQPATGEALADIDISLSSVSKTTLAVVAIWNPQNPTVELGQGRYARLYTLADLDDFDYIVQGQYTGATVMDSDYVYGQTETQSICETTFPAGAIEFTYTVTSPLAVPLEGAQVWISTDIAGTNVIWSGLTDTFGIARDVNLQKPWLDVGTYYFWSQLAGYSFTNPDTETVS